jgi:polyisoprenoid-binding protein YceI
LVDALNEPHVFCNVTLKITFQNIGMSAQFFTEMYATRAAYSARLNSASLSIPAEMLSLSYGAHFQTTYTFDKGYTSVGFGLNHDSLGFSPSMSLQMSLSL